MTTFVEGGTANTPFGVNEFLRSIRGIKREHYTVAASTIPVQTIDGVGGQKILQRGVVMAKIDTGLEAGKIGPFQAAGTAEVQTVTGGGTISGGTFTITQDGKTTAPIAWNAVAATVQSALQAVGINAVVTGGPIASTPFTLTFPAGGNVSQVTVSAASLTGTSPTLTPATGTPGVAGANDGRQTLANIVGINETFLPWQLMERDVEAACVYEASVVQGWCFEMTTAGLLVPLSNTTAAAMQRGGAAGKGVDITFK